GEMPQVPRPPAGRAGRGRVSSRVWRVAAAGTFGPLAAFSSRNESVAVVTVGRQRIWSVLRDADALASLTPLVRSIDVDGDVWTWHLRGISALGASVAPTFTERMTFDEPREIGFAHRPPDGRSERAGANGTYVLDAVGDESTRLSIDITLCVELPLPRLSRRAVEKAMAAMMQRTGDRFAVNLYQRLGIDAAGVDAPTAPSRRR
ncbi:MAG: Polyketide cyclase / dehydrase and lipid transport, partial [Ilumatobacteraceae bacterium]|nr:Polyketide cyclase / dehydrase and lipid transport [Ilumatobacteraceae bacterium]